MDTVPVTAICVREQKITARAMGAYVPELMEETAIIMVFVPEQGVIMVPVPECLLDIVRPHVPVPV